MQGRGGPRQCLEHGLAQRPVVVEEAGGVGGLFQAAVVGAEQACGVGPHQQALQTAEGDAGAGGEGLVADDLVPHVAGAQGVDQAAGVGQPDMTGARQRTAGAADPQGQGADLRLRGAGAARLGPGAGPGSGAARLPGRLGRRCRGRAPGERGGLGRHGEQGRDTQVAAGAGGAGTPQGVRPRQPQPAVVGAGREAGAVHGDRRVRDRQRQQPAGTVAQVRLAASVAPRQRTVLVRGRTVVAAGVGDQSGGGEGRTAAAGAGRVAVELGLGGVVALLGQPGGMDTEHPGELLALRGEGWALPAAQRAT